MKVKVTKKGGPFYTFLNEDQGHQKGALLTPFYLNMNSNVNFVLFTTIDLLKMFTPKCLGFFF